MASIYLVKTIDSTGTTYHFQVVGPEGNPMVAGFFDGTQATDFAEAAQQYAKERGWEDEIVVEEYKFVE